MIDHEPKGRRERHRGERVVDRREALDPGMRGRGQKTDRKQQQKVVKDLNLLGDGGVERKPADHQHRRYRQHGHHNADKAGRRHAASFAQMLDHAAVGGAPGAHPTDAAVTIVEGWRVGWAGIAFRRGWRGT